MVRGLVESGIDMIREERLEQVAEKAEENAESRLLDLLLPPPPAPVSSSTAGFALPAENGDSASRTREKLRQQLREGALDDRQVEIEVREHNMPTFEIISNQGIDDINIKEILPNIFAQRPKKRKMKVTEPYAYLIHYEH